MQMLLPAETSGNLIGSVHLADCLELCERVYRAGVRVDMIACDLPYQVHEAAWDSIIPIAPMWEAFKRIIKPRGAIVLTCVMGFGWQLIAGNPTWFKYDMVGVKTAPTDFINAHNKPMRGHENILVFSNGTTANGSNNRMPYYPQMLTGTPYKKMDYARTKGNSVFGTTGRKAFAVDKLHEREDRYPTTVLRQQTQNFEGNLHPNQKDVELFRWIVRSYTLPDEIVFDPCVGSGTTADAAREEGRRFIVGDSSSEYVQVARNRLAQPYTPSFMPQLEAV